MTKQTKDVQTVIDELATKGVEALDAMANFTQEQVDHIVHHAAIAALAKLIVSDCKFVCKCSVIFYPYFLKKTIVVCFFANK